MTDQKGFLDRQPLFFQFMIFIFLIIACSTMCVQLAFVLVKPLFGIVGADLLIEKATNSSPELVNNMNDINALKFIQILSSAGMFLLPAILFGFAKKQDPDFLKLKFRSRKSLVLLSIAIIILSSPLVNEIYILNKSWREHLPPVAHNYFTELENGNEFMTTLFLQMPGFTDLLINIFVIALLPALAEELFFRGVLQQMLTQAFRNSHFAIWSAAALFSFFHSDFSGFLPRFLLGAVMGYMFYWSQSLLVNITAHFFNNAIQLVLVFLYDNNIITINISSNESVPLPVTIIFTISAAVCLILFFRKRLPHQAISNFNTMQEELNLPPNG